MYGICNEIVGSRVLFRVHTIKKTRIPADDLYMMSLRHLHSRSADTNDGGVAPETREGCRSTCRCKYDNIYRTFSRQVSSGIWNRVRFLNNFLNETTKVCWPCRKQYLGTTMQWNGHHVWQCWFNKKTIEGSPIANWQPGVIFDCHTFYPELQKIFQYVCDSLVWSPVRVASAGTGSMRIQKAQSSGSCHLIDLTTATSVKSSLKANTSTAVMSGFHLRLQMWARV